MAVSEQWEAVTLEAIFMSHGSYCNYQFLIFKCHHGKVKFVIMI